MVNQSIACKYLISPSWKEIQDKPGERYNEVTDPVKVRRQFYQRLSSADHWMIIIGGTTDADVLMGLVRLSQAIVTCPVDSPAEVFDLLQLINGFVLVVPKAAVPQAVMERIVTAAQNELPSYASAQDATTSFADRDIVFLYASENYPVDTVIDVLTVWSHPSWHDAR